MWVTGFYLLVWLYQSGTNAPAAPVAPSQVLAAARQAFGAKDYAQTDTLLQSLVADGHGEAMMLAADANFALATPRSLRRAINLYERCLYEDSSIPFPDHSYHQLAQIYLLQSQQARDQGQLYEAREMASEATFYLSRLIKKYPDSYYRDTSLNALLDQALERHKYEDVRRWAQTIWSSATDSRLLSRVEPIVFINQEPFNASLAELRETYARHPDFIHRSRNLLLEYAKRFEAFGELDRARELYLRLYNQWPQGDDSATSLRRLADLHRALGQVDEAFSLYRLILAENPNTPAEAETWWSLAKMMEQGHVNELIIGPGNVLTYRELIDRIRLSSLPDDVRAEYSYKLALLEGFSDSERALMIMRNLLGEYERGPYVGLYRKYYELLLFNTIQSRFDQGRYWDLDRIYRQHHQFLAFTTQTRYPYLVAQAYLLLDLPSSALQVYESMWSYKESIKGFDLAFEEPLTDYLLLLDKMRRDDKLRFRLADYAAAYARDGRFVDRLRYVEARYKARTLPREELFAYLREQPTAIASNYDAQRLRMMILMAQEAALIFAENQRQAREKKDNKALASAIEREREAWALASGWYEKALEWPQLSTELPELFREAQLFAADRLYELGNYYESERRYQQVLADTNFRASDRDWAYLQLARLHELKGEHQISMRIYGQLAYAKSKESAMLAAYAKQRMDSLASDKRLNQLQEDAGLGQL